MEKDANEKIFEINVKKKKSKSFIMPRKGGLLQIRWLAQ